VEEVWWEEKGGLQWLGQAPPELVTRFSDNLTRFTSFEPLWVSTEAELPWFVLSTVNDTRA
jgi:hypothetical protein